MLTITIYLNTLFDDRGVVEACWRAIEELRAVYGVTVFLEVLDASLLSFGGFEGPVVVVGDVVVKAGGCSFEELKDRVVDAVLRSIVFKAKRGEAALDLTISAQAPRESLEVA
jgi:hypothetical protein